MKKANDQSKNPEFYNRFRKLVDDEGGQAKFASKTGISRQTIGFWYNGDRVPDAERLTILSKTCNKSVDWLLGLTSIDNASNDEIIKQISEYMHLSNKAIEVINSNAFNCSALVNAIVTNSLFNVVGFFVNNANQINNVPGVQEHRYDGLAALHLLDNGDVLLDGMTGRDLLIQEATDLLKTIIRESIEAGLLDMEV